MVSSSQSPGSSSSLPPNVTRLPASVTDLVSCVSHEIKVIEKELDQQMQHDIISERKLRTTDEERLLEDAIDDGFMCVDLKVLERKLIAWHRLFSPAFCNTNNNDNDNNEPPYNYTVTPYFAVKCNPDACVVEWLARTASMMNLPLGYDCASIAELELAKSQIQNYSLEETDGDNKKRNNIPTTRIVYANPQRAEADLMHALELFATPSSQSQSKELELWLTLDGVEEVYKIATARKLFLEKHHAGDDNNSSNSNALLQMPNVKIVLRIWVPDGHSQVPLGEKFGMRLEEIDNVIEACLNHGIIADDIIGISYHCGSGCSSVETYLEALEMGRKALTKIDVRLTRHYREVQEEKESEIQESKLQKLHESQSQQKQYKRHRCWLLDMGGGFPGIDGLDGDDGRFSANAKAEEKETSDTSMAATTQQTQTTVADIAMAVRPVLQSLTNNNDKDENDSSSLPLILIAEPGRYFVEGAIALASRIYQKGQVKDPNDDSNKIREYRIPHGVQGVFKDVLLCGESFKPQPLRINDLDDPTTADDQQDSSKQESPELYLSRVLGPSGDDTEDVVCDSCLLPELDVGDWLVFDRMGAYTLSIASRAGRPVMRYVRGDSSSP
jgi:ornithine decarboxylase